MNWVYILIGILQSIIAHSLDLSSPFVLQQAEYAVKELSKLSDSGIYNTLALKSILRAEEIKGIYHNNVLLDLELSSPFFETGLQSEIVSMVVMNHKVENFISIAIKEFPKMKETSVEDFYIKNIERRRSEREKAFLNLEMYMDQKN